MKNATVKLRPQSIKLDSKESYTRLFSTKNGDALSFRSGYVILKEGENIGEHNTGDSEEIIIGLRGKGELSLGAGEKLTIEKDTALYVPPRTSHNVRNVGNARLKYIFITAQTSPRLRKEG